MTLVVGCQDPPPLGTTLASVVKMMPLPARMLTVLLPTTLPSLADEALAWTLVVRLRPTFALTLPFWSPAILMARTPWG